MRDNKMAQQDPVKNKSKNKISLKISELLSNAGDSTSDVQPQVSNVSKEEVNELIEEKKLLESEKVKLDEREKELIAVQEKNTLRQKEILKKEVELEAKSQEIKAGLPAFFEENFKAAKAKFQETHDEFTKKNELLESRRQTLLKLQSDVEKAQADMNNNFAEKRATQELELISTREKKLKSITAAHNELIIKYQKEAEQLRQELHERFIAKQSENAKELELARAKFEDEVRTGKERAAKELRAEREQLKLQEEILLKSQAKLASENSDLDFEKMQTNSAKQKLQSRELGLDAEVDEMLSARLTSFSEEKNRLENECERLRANVNASSTQLDLYKELKQKLDGKAPEQLLKEFTQYQAEISTLHEELLKRPEQETLVAYSELTKGKEQLETLNENKAAQITELERKVRELESNSFEVVKLEENINDLQVRNDASGRRVNELQAELERLSPSTQAEQKREERIEQIRLPLINLNDVQKNQLEHFTKSQINRTEIDWLQSIYLQTSDYGLTFNPRILFAFHTALKTAEWSPITVLAGVSGTGKSELPRLYSRFGGINFLNLPVQPNWDSQESMLGFFNSIDNCFDAQPVLRLLAQSQQPCTQDYPGLETGVNIVLLDEMNLAHVELYFADFLSKLEQRRGSKKSELPSLEIKLGSGIEPYNLPIGRNVMWVGTMNQDETTKALSDKVLDRGIAIHFPRPKELHSRQFKSLPEQSDLLNIKEWATWVSHKSDLPATFFKDYKNIIEMLNDCMSTVGRAIGHRVWQSVENYMFNYPMIIQITTELAKENEITELTPKSDKTVTLEKWLKLAFEDQLVQKVMPKLRGIETRGIGKKECLDPIRQLLEEKGFGIVEDFDRACKFGYGQFMWNSAEYLNNTELFNEFTGELDALDETENSDADDENTGKKEG